MFLQLPTLSLAAASFINDDVNLLQTHARKNVGELDAAGALDAGASVITGWCDADDWFTKKFNDLQADANQIYSDIAACNIQNPEEASVNAAKVAHETCRIQQLALKTTGVTQDCEDDKEKDCKLLQSTFESVYCAYAASQDNFCLERQACHAAAATAAAAKKAAVEWNENMLKDQYKASKKYEYAMAQWPLNADEKSKYDAMDADASHLSVVYPSKPVPAVCNAISPLPGDDAWKTTFYGGRNWTSACSPVNACAFDASSACAEIHAAGNTASGTYKVKFTTGARNMYCDMDSDDGKWMLVTVARGRTSVTTDPEGKYQKYPVDGYKEDLLSQNTDDWASLSEADFKAAWFANSATVMKVVVTKSGIGDRTYYLQRSHDGDFSPFRGIRYVPEWGAASTDYRICDIRYNCYNAADATVTHDGGTMNHWEDHTVGPLQNGKSYTVSRHGITGDHKEGAEWMYIFGTHSCDNTNTNAMYGAGQCYSNPGYDTMTKIYLGGK